MTHPFSCIACKHNSVLVVCVTWNVPGGKKDAGLRLPYCRTAVHVCTTWHGTYLDPSRVTWNTKEIDVRVATHHCACPFAVTLCPNRTVGYGADLFAAEVLSSMSATATVMIMMILKC